MTNRYTVGPWPQRFWDMTQRSEDGCLNWTGGCDADGYGRVSIARRPKSAHRVAWELTNGAIGVGLQIDHLCRNRRCVEPTHLEPVTPAENRRRGLQGELRVACPRGHAYTEENTLPDKRGRRCRTCSRESCREYRQARKAKVAS